MKHSHDITSLEALERLYNGPNPNSLAKETRALTPEYRRWIERAPFLSIATGGPAGMDCSPRGDREGELVKILADDLIALADRRGNNRLDTLKNIVADPRVALLFLIPGINETMRINGRATITTDPDLLREMAIDGKPPASVIRIAIDSVYFQCARALVRSKLWDETAQISKSAVPTAGQMLKAGLPDFDGERYDSEWPDRQNETLY